MICLPVLYCVRSANNGLSKSVSSRPETVGGGGNTERGELWAGGETIVGEVGNKDLRRMDRGVRCLARAEAAGTGGEQDRR